MHRPLISVCLIVRDEERFLPGALESVRGLADEIVVVDTGSTDDTVAIARFHGARVVRRAWDDDYSAARNAAHPHARGEWLLWLDADERVAGGAEAGPELRRRLLAAPVTVGGYVVERHDVITADNGRTDVFPVGMVRLFRNDARVRWTGIVHERPGDSIAAAGLELHIATSFKLTHLVHQLSAARLREKQERYLALLDRELRSDENNAWARYYRGKTHWYLTRHDEALDDFERVAADSTARPFLRASAHAMRGALLAERDDTDAALIALESSLALVPDQSLARALLGEVRYQRGEYETAHDQWSQVRLSLGPAAPGEIVPGDFYMNFEKRAYKLGCARLALGRIQEAAHHFDEGLRHNRDDAGCWFGLAHVARLRGDTEGARMMISACRAADPGWADARRFEADHTPP